MKIVFSTKNVTRASFLDTCKYAFDYGFEGFEIYDAIKERKQHYMDTFELVVDHEMDTVMDNVLYDVLKHSFRREIIDE